MLGLRVGGMVAPMPRVLVTYSSRHGSTAEIAETLAAKLREYELIVDCRPVSLVNSLAAYDAIVVGSAVYAGHWRLDARHFLERFAGELWERPVWAFSSGPVGENQPEPGATAPVVPELKRIRPRDHVIFGGRVSPAGQLPLARMMIARLAPVFRDRRDWGQVRVWASEIAEQLDDRPVRTDVSDDEPVEIPGQPDRPARGGRPAT